MSRIAESELIINPDGSVFHLHLKPGEVGEYVFLVGDPDRVDLISRNFDSVEIKAKNREFVSHSGYYKGRKVTVTSTGIGTDNIDIVLNELDALVNIDFHTRLPKKEMKQLKIIRIGTSGSLQADLPVNSWLVSEKAIGFDGLLNFYLNRDSICDLGFEKQLKECLSWSAKLTSPYVCNASEDLLGRLSSDETVLGVTISAPGFYGPQGRVLRLPLVDSTINEKISAFRYDKYRITNYEMECSAIYGLSKLLGHQAVTMCLIIANRQTGTFSENYKEEMKKLVIFAMKNIVL